MISSRDVLTALYGAFRLARFDPSGLDFFEQTETGFWRSFFAAVLVAPFYLILTSVRYSGLTETVPFVRFLAIEMIAYVIAWAAFPLLMASLTRSLDREAHYIRYIVAYNWAAVWQNALYMPVALLSVSAVLSAANVNVLGLLALGLIVIYVWFVTKTALEVSGGMAAGIVGIDFFLSILINTFATGIL
jgi:hypothetical protein